VAVHDARAAVNYARHRVHERALTRRYGAGTRGLLQRARRRWLRKRSDVNIEYRWAQGDYGRLPAHAAELVQKRVTVLVATGGDASARAAKEATTAIPVVFNTGSDPVRAGLVQSLNRPGGNATGAVVLSDMMEQKRALTKLATDRRMSVFCTKRTSRD